MNMDRVYSFVLGFLAVTLMISFVSARDDVCPASCFCNTNSKIVYCSRRGLQKIPTESIPSNSLQLNLNGNIFQYTLIRRSNFSRFSLLEHLYLSECGIEKVEVDTFTDLRKLKWLDLSNNRIKLIEEYTFRGLSLMHLFLNGNRNINLRKDSFAGLATTGLYLHECSLSKLSLEVFAHLNNSLKNLWLYGNELTKVDKRFHPMFVSLTHLRLGSNPFHCNCEIKWLKEMYDQYTDKFDGAVTPACLNPTKFKGKFFNQIKLSEFQCQPPYFKNIDAVFKGSKGMLRCTASGDPSPKLYWIQPSGHSTLYKPPNNESVRFNQAVLNISAEHTRYNDLSGSYFCVAINDAGNMTFTFNVTWPSTAAQQSNPSNNNKPRLPNRNDGEVTYETIPAHINLGIKNADNNDKNNNEDEKSTTTTQVPNDKVHPKTVVNILSTKSPVPAEEVDIDLDNKPKVKTKSGEVFVVKNASDADSINNKKDTNVIKTQKMFTLTELIGAVVGTFICTLIFCFILIYLIYFRRKWKNNNSPRHGNGGVNKPSLQEVRYLNGMGNHSTQTYNYRDYFDTPGSLGSLKR